LSLKYKTITFLGAGNMAEALMIGILKAQLAPKENIVATDVQASRLAQVVQSLGIQPCDSNQEAVKRGSIIVLAVKPQNLKELMEEISSELTSEKCVISIAAGVRTEKLEALAKKKLRLIRVMPNMAALVQKGVAALFKGPNATDEDLEIAKSLLSAVGKVLEVTKEDQLDAVTALSGSGPAYFFYFVEALKEAGLHLGLSEKVVHTLVLGTAEGAVELLNRSTDSPAELRKKVTSPGGTTEAALKVLMEKKFVELLKNALQAAADRSKELSQY